MGRAPNGGRGSTVSLFFSLIAAINACMLPPVVTLRKLFSLLSRGVGWGEGSSAGVRGVRVPLLSPPPPDDDPR